MPFTDIEAPAPSGGPQVKLSATERRGGEIVTIRLNVPSAILGEIGNATDKYRVQLGDGDDRGWLRLVKDKDGPFPPRMCGSGLHEGVKGTPAFYLGETEFAPDRKQKGTPCNWKKDGNALLIHLPSWAFLAPNDDGESA